MALSCPHHKFPWPQALAFPCAPFYLKSLIPPLPLGLSRTSFPNVGAHCLHTTHPATYGNVAENEHFSQKIKIYIGKALLAAALPQSRRFKGSSEWKSLSGAVSFFLEAVF